MKKVEVAKNICLIFLTSILVRFYVPIELKLQYVHRRNQSHPALFVDMFSCFTSMVKDPSAIFIYLGFSKFAKPIWLAGQYQSNDVLKNYYDLYYTVHLKCKKQYGFSSKNRNDPMSHLKWLAKKYYLCSLALYKYLKFF